MFDDGVHCQYCDFILNSSPVSVPFGNGSTAAVEVIRLTHMLYHQLSSTGMRTPGNGRGARILGQRLRQFVQIAPGIFKICPDLLCTVFFGSKFVRIGRIRPKIATEEQGTSEIRESKV